MTFKFFREYNKILLITGGSLLMFVFLIQGTLGTGRGDMGAQVIGTMKGRDVTLSQKVKANEELRVLQAMGFAGISRVVGTPDQGALKWLLIIQDAQDMGIDAGTSETDAILKQMKITDAASLTTAAQNIGVSTDVIREAARKLVIFMSYDRLTSAREVRLSQAEIDHSLLDFLSRVKISYALISAQKNLPNATEPDEKTLNELFEKYKDSLPGQSKPYGIGFKLPSRAKVEFLTVPMDRIRETVSVDEVEALAYYDAHKDQFAEKAPQGQTQPVEPRVKSYDEVAGDVRKQLLMEKTRAKAERIVRTASGLLATDSANLADQGGYKVLPENFRPTPLSSVAKQIEQQFRILPDVVILNDRWLTEAELKQTPGIGQAYLFNGMQISSATDYLFSAKEFGTTGDQPLAVLRFQVGLASVPLRKFDGSPVIARLTAVEPARKPLNLHEVESQVAGAAMLLSSYKQLIDSEDRRLERSQAVGLAGLAKEFDLTVMTPPAFTRRQINQQRAVVVPSIEGIGPDQAFVDKVFDVATKLEDQGGVDKTPAAKRLFVVPVDSKMSLAVVEIEELQALPKSMAEYYKMQPQTAFQLNSAITGVSNVPHVMSLQVLAKRVGFVGKHGEEKGEEKQQQEEEQPMGFGGDDDQG
jgi:hypothetical protein